jgi:hypothetical protein
MGIAVVGNKMATNRMKWYQVAKRGDKPTQEMMDAYIKLGGAVVEIEVKEVKKEVKKVDGKKEFVKEIKARAKKLKE